MWFSFCSSDSKLLLHSSPFHFKLWTLCKDFSSWLAVSKAFFVWHLVYNKRFYSSWCFSPYPSFLSGEAFCIRSSEEERERVGSQRNGEVSGLYSDSVPQCLYAWQDHGLRSRRHGCHEERVADVAAWEQTACRSSAERAEVSVVRESLLYLSRQICF